MVMLIALIGIVAGVVSGVIGAGSSMILLPVLSATYSPQTAISVMAIASIMGNISRVIVWYKEIQIKPLLIYAIPAMPAAILGTKTLLHISVISSEFGMGLFFLMMIPIRHSIKKLSHGVNYIYLALSGIVIGFLTGLMFSTGPLSISMFAGFGLTRGGLLSTESAASFLLYLTKATTFAAMGALPTTVIISGLMVGCTVVIGTYLGKHFVLKMSDQLHGRFIDGVSLAAGVSMLGHATLLLLNR